MLKLIRANALFLALALVVVLTRGTHFGSSFRLPDAMLAACFGLGLLERRASRFVALMLVAVACDVFSFAAGVSTACLSFGYFMLVPAWACLFAAARASRNAASPAYTAGALLLGTMAWFVVSNAGYYAFSSHGALAPLVFAERTIGYLPTYLATTFGYVGLGALVARSSSRRLRATSNDVV